MYHPAGKTVVYPFPSWISIGFPLGAINEVPAMGSTFTLTPLIKLSDVKTKHVTPNLYKISVVIKNTGFLPSNITERAKNAKIAKSVVVEIILDDKSKLVIGKKKAEIGHLEGRSKKLPGRFYTLLGPKKEPPGRFYGGNWGGEGDTTSKYVEWLIKTSSEKPNVLIKVVSEKGGTDSKKIKITPHQNQIS